MAKNVRYAPNGPNNTMSLAVASSSGNPVVSGSPVKVGQYVGVAITDYFTDHKNLRVINNNEPGHVTVWNGCVATFSVYVETGAKEKGTPVYAYHPANNSSLVGLTTKVGTKDGHDDLAYLFGTLDDDGVVGGNAKQTVAVRINTLAGPTINNS